MSEITDRLQELARQMHRAVMEIDRDLLVQCLAEHRKLSAEIDQLAPRVFDNPDPTTPL